jgi:subtilisin family serine protease
MRAFVFVSRHVMPRTILALMPYPLRALAVALTLSAATTPALADIEGALKDIERTGQARIIVRMKTDAGQRSWAAASSAGEQRAMVTEATPQVERALRRANARMEKRFNTLPFVATTVDREQLLSLAAAPEVAAIYSVQIERPSQLVGVERPVVASSVPSIDVAGAWAAGYDGTGYAVAVIDTGINVAHPMLAGKAVGAACFGADYGTDTKNQCPSGRTPEIAPGAASNCGTSERCRHGTLTASIAVGNDGATFGVARGAKLVPVDVFSRVTDPTVCAPDPAPCELTDSLAVLSALDYINERAAEYKIAAVNISLGGGNNEAYCDNDARRPVVDMLRAKGIAVTAASGNEGRTGGIHAPSCISSAIAVGATADDTSVATFSNFSRIVDVMAPGASITGAHWSGSGYYTTQGTSVAAPHVAGAWAILRQALPQASAATLEDGLKRNGLRTTRADTGIEVPKIQVYRTLLNLQGRDRLSVNHVASSQAPVPRDSFMRLYNDSTVAGTVLLTFRDAATGAALGSWRTGSIEPHASHQFLVDRLEQDAQVVPTGGYFNIEVESTFKGHMQHVLWGQGVGVLSNMSSCSTGPSSDSRVAMNVHTSAVADYQSRLRVVNTGTAAGRAVLSIYHSGTGAKIGQWTSAEIAAGAAVEVTQSQLETVLPDLGTAASLGTNQVNVVLSEMPGYLQHIVFNGRAAVTVDLSGKCNMGPR